MMKHYGGVLDARPAAAARGPCGVWTMLSAWWKRRARARTGRPARAASTKRSPPALECLEDRCLLATGLSLASLGGVTLHEFVNQQFTAPVAHVRLAGASDVKVAIDWGDGQTSAG